MRQPIGWGSYLILLKVVLAGRVCLSDAIDLEVTMPATTMVTAVALIVQILQAPVQKKGMCKHMHCLLCMYVSM